jgi:predicted RNA-binding protein with PIN domain
MKWLIDGHNLIGQMPGLSLSDPDDENKLLEYLRQYRARTGHTLTVVFDAGPDYHVAEKRQQGGITVQYAPHGQTADRIIIGRLRRVKNPQEVMVVTSDRAVQQAARQVRVRVISAEEFAQQLVHPISDSGEEEGAQADVHLSEEEIKAWLALFKRSKK